MKSLLAILLLSCAASTGAQAPAALAQFGWFAELAGACWSGRFPDGKTVHTQCYTTQFDRFLRGTATLAVDRDGRLERQFEGDSLFAVDRNSGRIVYFIWGSDGSHGRLEASWLGDELAFPVPSRKDPAQIAYRSVWRRLAPDAFEVRRERPAGAAWSTEFTVTYRKAPPAPIGDAAKGRGEPPS